MKSLPSIRRQHIVNWLQEENALSIRELAKRLNVSSMTVHRDLDRLADEGLVEKIRGGARLASVTAPLQERCELCQQQISRRTGVTIRLADGTSLKACCPHCGLLLLAHQDDVVAALARDFLYSRVVDMRSSFYVVDSAVQLCCLPSTICFGSREDARRFSLGFGGEVLDAAAAQSFHMHAHHAQS